ncbi:NIL domain-containing protein [Chloroflexota bacterium]
MSNGSDKKKRVKRRVTLTFTQELISEPVIYTLSQQFNVTTNIHRADVSEEKGWVILEIEGEEDDIEQGIAWVTSKGVRVEPVDGDIAED